MVSIASKKNWGSDSHSSLGAVISVKSSAKRVEREPSFPEAQGLRCIPKLTVLASSGGVVCVGFSNAWGKIADSQNRSGGLQSPSTPRKRVTTKSTKSTKDRKNV